MAVKVVQGLVGGVKPGQPHSNTDNQTKVQQVTQNVHTQVLQSQTNEAVVSSVRLTRATSQAPDKLRDSKEAKKLADDVAERITERAEKGDKDGANPHKGLDNLSAPEHLLN